MMKKLLCIAIGAVSLTACKSATAEKPLCDVLFKSVTAAAQGVANTLDCANVPAIAGSLWKPLTANLNLCADTAASGLVGNLVCGQVAKTVLSVGLGTLPADWKCKGGALGDKAETIIAEKCKEAVPF